MVKFMADYSFRTGFFGKACAILNKRELPGNEQKTSAGETFCLVALPWGHTCVGRSRDVFSAAALFQFALPLFSVVKTEAPEWCRHYVPALILPSLSFRKRDVKSKLLACLTGIFILSFPSLLWAGKPMDEIRVAVTQALQILKDPEMKSSHERKELDARLEKIIDPVFDFREMAKRSLGIHWRDLTREERQEFVPLFKDFLAQVYLGRIGSYKGEKVRFTSETVGMNYAEVDTQVVAKNGDRVPVIGRFMTLSWTTLALITTIGPSLIG